MRFGTAPARWSDRLREAAESDRPCFDAARHERLMRAVRAAPAPSSRTRPALPRWLGYAAAAAAVAATCALGLLSTMVGRGRGPANTTPGAVSASLLEDALEVVLEVDPAAIADRRADAADIVRQWVVLEDDAALALDLLDRVAIQLAMAPAR